MVIKGIACAHTGFGTYALEELKEILGKDAELISDVVLFDTKLSQLCTLFQRLQSSTSLGIFLGKAKEAKDLKIDLSGLKDVLGKEEAKFTIKYLNVKGNENRIALGKDLYPIIGNSFRKELGKELKVDFKEYDFVFQLYFTGEEYLLSLRVHKEDLDQREYRVYAHQASFRGDFAYALIREAELNKYEKCLVLFAKDATLSIEAAAHQNDFPLRGMEGFCLEKGKEIEKKIKKKVYSIEESMGNLRSAKNNAKIAGISEALEIMKVRLDDLEVKIQHESIDKIFVLMGRRDEERLNELYYQLALVLKKGGKVAFLTRPVFDLVVGSKFKIIKDKELHKGQSAYKFYLIEKN